MAHDGLKQSAARHALQFVSNGMVLGLGTGATASYFTEYLAEKLRQRALTDVQVVPTSERSATLARNHGISLTTLVEHPALDLAVDGADEVDPNMNLVKGLGRALLREKIVAAHSRQFIIICDESKLVKRLCERVPLPVEILPFEAGAHVRWLNTLGCRAELWIEEDGSPALTDNGNCLARCWFEDGISDPWALAHQLAYRPGILEHGLFLGMAEKVIVAKPDGIVLMESHFGEEQE